MDIEDTEACYRAVKSRDRRFDGVFYTGVTSTGIYCRPSCPALTPAKKNVTFHRSAAAAQAAGFRACKRCLPDATPGSPDWDVAADVAGRAMRLICDGLVEREGVEGLAGRVGYTPAAPAAAAGPRAGRRPAGAGPGAPRPERPRADRDHADAVRRRRLRGRLRQRPPVQRHRPRGLRQHPDPAARAAPAGATRGRDRGTVASCGCRSGRRTPGASCCASWPRTWCRGSRQRAGLVRAHPRAAARPRPRPARPSRRRRRRADRLRARPRSSRRPARRRRRRGALPPAARRRRDPAAVDDALAATRDGPLVRAPPRPAGARAASTATRSRSGRARPADLAGRRAHRRRQAGAALRRRRLGDGRPTGSAPLFPSAATLAEVDPATLPMPRARGRALVGLCAALADGDVPLDRGADRAEVRARRCWRCPASARGRPTTSRCGRSATPTCSCPPTSACAAR